jgi:hypothetical protein
MPVATLVGLSQSFCHCTYNMITCKCAKLNLATARSYSLSLLQIVLLPNGPIGLSISQLVAVAVKRWSWGHRPPRSEPGFPKLPQKLTISKVEGWIDGDCTMGVSPANLWARTAPGL